MAMHPRIGQVISLIFILLTAGLFVASLFFPLFTLTVTGDVCNWSQSRTQSAWTSSCPASCSASATPLPSCFGNLTQTTWGRCPQTVTDWRDQCPKDIMKCERQSYVYFVVWIVMIGTCGFTGIALILYIVHMIVISATPAIAVLGFTIFLSLVGVVGFSVGNVIATHDDYVDTYHLATSGSCDDASSQADPYTNVGCGSFIGSYQSACENTKYSWAPDLGWILFTAGMGLAVLTLIVMMLVGRGQKKLNAF